MDDMKKAAYIRARERLETGESNYVCLALQDALDEITGGELDILVTREVFLEFFNLFDGSYWTPEGDTYENINSSRIWWEGRWKEPRLRIIDTIMSQE